MFECMVLKRTCNKRDSIKCVCTLIATLRIDSFLSSLNVRFSVYFSFDMRDIIVAERQLAKFNRLLTHSQLSHFDIRVITQTNMQALRNRITRENVRAQRVSNKQYNTEVYVYFQLPQTLRQSHVLISHICILHA